MKKLSRNQITELVNIQLGHKTSSMVFMEELHGDILVHLEIFESCDFDESGIIEVMEDIPVQAIDKRLEGAGEQRVRGAGGDLPGRQAIDRQGKFPAGEARAFFIGIVGDWYMRVLNLTDNKWGYSSRACNLLARINQW